MSGAARGDRATETLRGGLCGSDEGTRHSAAPPGAVPRTERETRVHKPGYRRPRHHRRRGRHAAAPSLTTPAPSATIHGPPRSSPPGGHGRVRRVGAGAARAVPHHSSGQGREGSSSLRVRSLGTRTSGQGAGVRRGEGRERHMMAKEAAPPARELPRRSSIPHGWQLWRPRDCWTPALAATSSARPSSTCVPVTPYSSARTASPTRATAVGVPCSARTVSGAPWRPPPAPMRPGRSTGSGRRRPNTPGATPSTTPSSCFFASFRRPEPPPRPGAPGGGGAQAGRCSRSGRSSGVRGIRPGIAWHACLERGYTH